MWCEGVQKVCDVHECVCVLCCCVCLKIDINPWPWCRAKVKSEYRWLIYLAQIKICEGNKMEGKNRPYDCFKREKGCRSHNPSQ
jgi:hypothetical protein